MERAALRLCTAGLCLLAYGCTSNTAVPVTDRSSNKEGVTVTSRTTPAQRPQGRRHAVQAGASTYVVRRGDTLYSIAWSAGLDYHSLADWNDVPPPYVIKPGQRLTLVPPAGEPGKRPAVTPPAPAKTTDMARPAASEASVEGWIWPVKGPILSHFSARSGNKGIDIGGTSGRGIRAAAGGKVVYAGSGLRGYGQLIIVKHDEVYLSAYAHNSKLLVEDGATVTRGQQIALMGSTGTDRVKLHFEIRQRGQPVNPLDYLPKRP